MCKQIARCFQMDFKKHGQGNPEAMPVDHVPDKYGRSELLLAVLDKDAEKVKALVAAGVNVNEGFQHNREEEDFDTLKMDVRLCDHWDCQYRNMYRGMTALSVASFYGPFETVKLLVDSGANLHSLSYWRRNCLDWAIEGNLLEIVKFLLSRNELDINVDLDKTEPLGCNPLYLAVWKCRWDKVTVDITKLLLDHGAIVSDSTYQLALESERNDVIELLSLHYTPKKAEPGCTCF